MGGKKDLPVEGGDEEGGNVWDEEEKCEPERRQARTTKTKNGSTQPIK